MIQRPSLYQGAAPAASFLETGRSETCSGSPGDTNAMTSLNNETAHDLNALIARYTSVGFDDVTPLLEAGLESLSLLRLAVDVATDDDAEINATQLVDLRTVADLKAWLLALATGESNTGVPQC